jgi:hypothetical protein
MYAQKTREIKNNEIKVLFLSSLDFKQAKATQITDFLHKGDKIKLNQFFISPDITVVEQNTKKSFPKDSIFAIQLTNGQNYRFINRKPYLIADTSFLYIYTRNDVKTEYKQSGPHTIHKEIPVTVYCFSFGDHKKVYSLTLVNLRKYILIDPVVHTAVCNKFTNDEMLSEINNSTGHFILNEIIRSKLNQ